MILTTYHSALRQARCYLRPLRTFSQTPFARLLSSLAVLEQREGKLQIASLSAVTAAQKLGASVTGFIAGSGIRSIAEEAAKVKGLEKIIMVENGAYDRVRSTCHIQSRLVMSTPNLDLGSS